MSIPLASRGFGVVILVVWFALSGCASLIKTDVRSIEMDSTAREGSQNGWSTVRIQWQWPADTDPAWHLDLFAAHQLFLPIVNAYDNELLLWRVHRRAARDAAGHQFSFIFFTSIQSAKAIFADIAADPLLRDIDAAGIMRQHEMELPATTLQSDIAATSDPNWSPAIQASWPQYIHGVCRMWINLVSLTANQKLAETVPGNVAETAEFYRQVETDITAIWQKEGRHAFLHHLNAIFGYEPIPVVEKRWLQF